MRTTLRPSGKTAVSSCFGLMPQGAMADLEGWNKARSGTNGPIQCKDMMGLGLEDFWPGNWGTNLFPSARRGQLQPHDVSYQQNSLAIIIHSNAFKAFTCCDGLLWVAATSAVNFRLDASFCVSFFIRLVEIDWTYKCSVRHLVYHLSYTCRRNLYFARVK